MLKKNIENQHFLKEMQHFLKEKKTYSDKIFFILYSFRIIESYRIVVVRNIFCLNLTTEPHQVIPSVWDHLLFIVRTHSVDKNPKRVRATSLFLTRYRIFSEFSLQDPIFQAKSNFWISTWNFAQIKVSTRLAFIENFRSFERSLSELWIFKRCMFYTVSMEKWL